MPFNIGSVGTTSFLPSIAEPKQADGVASGSFQKVLSNAESTLNGLQTDADSLTTKLAAGQPVELHEALLATEKATIAFQFAVQVRNKAIEAYQEVMRMQV